MFTTHDIAVILHHKLGVDEDTADRLVEGYISQIEQTDDRTIDREEVSDNDADFIIDSAAAGQRAGDLGHRELETLGDTMARIRAAEEERDPQIRAALKAGARVKDLTDLTGLSRARIYQIKDAG